MSNLVVAIPVLKVGGVAEAEAFYCAQLGFEREFLHCPGEGPEPGYLGVRRDAARLHLSSFPGDGVLGSTVHFVVGDVDALHEEFATRGVAIGLAPYDQTWGVREMHLRDPWGNRLTFGQPLG